MLKNLLIGLLITIALLTTSCTTLKNGYSEGFRRITLQKCIIVTSSRTGLNRVHFRGYTEPSKMLVKWYDFDPVYFPGDTLPITYSFMKKLKFLDNYHDELFININPDCIPIMPCKEALKIN